MKIINETQLDFSNVLIKPKRSEIVSRNDVNLFRTFKGRWNKNLKFSAVPIFLSNMDNITSTEMCRKLLENDCMVAHNKFVSYDEWVTLLGDDLFKTSLQECRLCVTVGIRKDSDGNYIEFEQFRKLKLKYPNVFKHLVIDAPSAYLNIFIDFLKIVRKEFPDLFITAGNVCTGSMTTELILAGADCIKTNIGAGNVCKTRIITGVGRPQLSTILDCSESAHALGAYIIADGGCVNVGDICKSFVGNTDFVMLGSMFAGTKECDGRIINKFEISHHDLVYGISDNPYEYYHKPIYVKKQYKEFWGMSSRRAQETHYGKMEKYRASEGREILVKYKGPVQEIINEIKGGLASCCTYINAKEIKHMGKCGQFYLVNNQVSNMFNDKD